VEFMSAAELFNCPNCNSQYKLVRVEADPAASYRQIECLTAAGLLTTAKGSSFSNTSLLTIHEGKSDRRAANRVLRRN
jgi:hypothetical protein